MIAELHAQSFFEGGVCSFIIVTSTQVLGTLTLVPLPLPESLIDGVLCVSVCIGMHVRVLTRGCLPSVLSYSAP